MGAEEDAAAARIQALQRGREARREAEERKQERKEQSEAASKIQALKRGREARREVEELKKERAEQNDAASKIQALQRGKEARRAAEEKRQQRQEENEAAAKIQSIQRGRRTRKEVEEQRVRKLGPFVRPFLSECDSSAVVDLRGGHRALEKYKSFEDFVDALQLEFPTRGIDRGKVYYSTVEQPDVFCNIVTQHKLDQWRAYCELTALQQRGDLGPVGWWEYGESNKKRYRILREQVEGKGLQLFYEQQFGGERGEAGPCRAELHVPGASEADKPPVPFAAHFVAKLKNGEEPDGTLWFHLKDDTFMETLYRPADKQGTVLQVTAIGKGRKSDTQEDTGKSKKQSVLQREEKEKKRRQKEIERELALRGHDINVQNEKLGNFLQMKALKIVFTGYKPTSAAAVLRHHLTCLAARDVSGLLMDYTGKSRLRLYGVQPTADRLECTGTAGAQQVCEELCRLLSDTSGLSCPVQDVDEDAVDGCGQAFMVWRCPSSGVATATATLHFDRMYHIRHHDITVMRL
eukprot:TRINITY_DN14378_c0_g1_i1.p1 TRINITY_DN14378_c0_g1~~TRINITY_DN14378_c0_g1_i1.p1  ORF type:complete len:521 (+),score=82.20 TRINITY_DN14378_c0_g1_i1:62-1624(+)